MTGFNENKYVLETVNGEYQRFKENGEVLVEGILDVEDILDALGIEYKKKSTFKNTEGLY